MLSVNPRPGEGFLGLSKLGSRSGNNVSLERDTMASHGSARTQAKRTSLSETRTIA